LLGLGCGIGLAFFTEYVDTSVKTVEDIEKYIGAPILGVIPQKVKPLVEEGPDSPHAEAYRVLRTNMQLSKKLGGGNTLCVTSGGAGEGKSLTLFNLAYVCARLGDRVLIVDSDLRRPTQHQILGVPNKPGLADVLLHGATVEQMIGKPRFPTCICSRAASPPPHLTAAGRASNEKALAAPIERQIRLHILDAPPMMGRERRFRHFQRGRRGAARGPASPLSARRFQPRKDDDRYIGGNLLGVVLNNINVTRDYYYYYHSYYYSAYRGTDERSHGETAAESKPKTDAF